MSDRFPADDEHLHPYPGNLRQHKVMTPDAHSRSYLSALNADYDDAVASKASSPWISVNDRLPDADGVYITCVVDYTLNTPNQTVTTRHFRLNPSWKEEPQWTSSLRDDFSTVTYWMPLPEPPKE